MFRVIETYRGITRPVDDKVHRRSSAVLIRDERAASQAAHLAGHCPPDCDVFVEEDGDEVRVGITGPGVDLTTTVAIIAA